MSASRERKQRIAGNEELTAKELKAAREAAQAKRKTIIYTIVGVVCVILVAALLIWDSGFLQRRAVAYTVDGTEYTVPEYTYFYMDAYNQFSSYGLITSDTDLDEIYDEETGQTWNDYFNSYAEQSLDRLTVLYNGALEADMSLTDEDRAALKENLVDYETAAAQYGYTLSAFLKANFGRYITEDIFLDILERQQLANMFYSDKQDSLTYGQDELESYYDENSGTLDTFVQNTCFISSSTSYFNTEDADEAKEQAKALADKMAEGLKEGGDFQTLAEEATQGQDNPSIYTGLTVPGDQLSSLYGTWLQDTARKAGDVTVVESSSGNGYFVVQFVDRYLLTSDTVNLRHILIRAETDEGADAPSAEQMSAAKAEVEELLAAWKSGEATEESFAALAKEGSDDSGSNTNGGFYNAYQGQMIANFDSWIFDSSRKSGDVGIVENDNTGSQGYHLIYYIGTDRPYWEQQAISSLQEQDMASWMDELTADLAVSSGSGMKYVG